jgi:mRNA interferase MazF
MVKIVPDSENKLDKISAADCFQVRSISEKRLVRRVGAISSNNLSKIRDGLMTVLSIG